MMLAPWSVTIVALVIPRNQGRVQESVRLAPAQLPFGTHPVGKLDYDLSLAHIEEQQGAADAHTAEGPGSKPWERRKRRRRRGRRTGRWSMLPAMSMPHSFQR